MPSKPRDDTGEGKYFEAVRALASGFGTLQERLTEASRCLVLLEKKHFPADMWATHKKIQSALADDQLDDAEAQKLANRIVSTYYELSRH